MSRGHRGALYLFLGSISLLVGAVAVAVAVPPLQLAYVATDFAPTGIYAAIVLVVAIATPILCALAAFATLWFGDD